RRAERTQIIANAKKVEHVKPNRLQNQSRTDWRWGVELVEHHHAMAHTLQQSRGRETGDAATGYGDVERAHVSDWNNKIRRNTNKILIMSRYRGVMDVQSNLDVALIRR